MQGCAKKASRVLHGGVSDLVAGPLTVLLRQPNFITELEEVLPPAPGRRRCVLVKPFAFATPRAPEASTSRISWGTSLSQLRSGNKSRITAAYAGCGRNPCTGKGRRRFNTHSHCGRNGLCRPVWRIPLRPGGRLHAAWHTSAGCADKMEALLNYWCARATRNLERLPSIVAFFLLCSAGMCSARGSRAVWFFISLQAYLLVDRVCVSIESSAELWRSLNDWCSVSNLCVFIDFNRSFFVFQYLKSKPQSEASSAQRAVVGLGHCVSCPDIA